MSTIAERLLMVRGSAKQGEFAKALSINPNTLRNYENGRVLPNQDILERICVQFSVSPVWLLLGTGSMYSQGEVPQNEVDLVQLTSALRVVEQALQDADRTLSFEKKAELIASVYDLLNDSKDTVQIIKLIRAVA